MKISEQEHRNGAIFYWLVLLAFFLALAGNAFAEGPLHVFNTGATAPIMNSNTIAGVGDIDQDGHEDYLVGVPENIDIVSYKGAVYLVSGANGGQLAMFEGESSYEMFGYGVASAGDVNQDGVNDFLIASRYALGDRAAVFVYSGADGARLHTLPSPYANTDFGKIMVSVGDKDGDGIPDFAIAAPYCYADHSGAVFLYSTAMGGTIIYEWSGDTQYGTFGQDLAAADIDGDGTLDLVISAPFKSEGSSENVGALYWVSGGFGPMTILAQGDIAVQQLGVRIAAVDDISGDGIKDIAALDNNGQIHLFSGVNPGGAPLGSFASGMTASEYAYWMQMVSVGDFNGDGAGDLLVGRPEADGFTGVVQIISALDGSLLKTYPTSPNGQFGSWLAANVDLDGNGSQDILIGADHVEIAAGGGISGAVFAYAGAGGLPPDDSDGDGMSDNWESNHGLDPQNPGDAALDPDADGLTNLGEYQNNTDPVNPDSDWDGILDGWEVEHGLNPNVFTDAMEDPDGDGLFNIDEFFLGTDPRNGDTDGDTLPDGWEFQNGLYPTDASDAGLDFDGDGLTNLAEYAAGTNPTRFDSDDDGLSDGDEIARGLNPLQEDSDGDSAPDGWEDQYGLDPLDGSDGPGDLDGDGLTNQSEYAAGTNPTLTDTDGDTLSDGDEANTYQTDPAKSDTDNDGLDDGAEITVHLTQPLNADSDGDQLTDGAEVNTHHTDPLDTDSDDDGMADGWEVTQAFDPNNAGDAAQDADNDAATNLAEFLAGTDPHNPANYPGAPGTLKWSFSAPPLVSPAGLDPDGTVYVTSMDSNLYALNADGTQKWSAALTSAFGKAPLIAEDGTIYLNEKHSTAPQTLYSIAPDGTLNWSVEIPGFRTMVHTPSLAGDGTIYVPAGATLMAINPDGTEKWTAATDGYDTSTPAVAHDGTIYVKSYGDKLYAFNPDGSQKWVFAMYASGKSPDAGPVIAEDGTVYVCDNGGTYHNGSVHAINPDGTEKWNYFIGQSRGAVAIGPDGTIYVSGNQFYALSADGALNWKVDLPGGIVSYPAIAEDGTLYVTGQSSPYPVHALNPDGSIEWTYESGKQEYMLDPVLAADGTLYVGSALGNLYAFNTNGIGPAASAWPMVGHDARHTGNAETPQNQTPEISIASPADGSVFNVDDGAIAFAATAADAEDGDLTSSVVWESSIDGIVQSPATLSVGTHTLTARVTDSGGLTTSESIECVVASTADQYAIKGGVGAYYVDNNNDGQFTQAVIGGDLSVAARRISFANSYYTKRANLEIDLSALRGSGQHVSRAAIKLYATAYGAYPFQIDIYGYAADGVAELADADGGDQIIGSFQADGTGNYEAEITDYINQLIDSGAQWVGLSLRSANESGTDGIDEHIDIKGFDYSSPVFAGAALLVSYAEPPVVSIASPADNAVVSEDDGPIAFAAMAADPEDGDISADVQWISSLDGAFTPPAALSVGTHTITASVTDSSGMTSDAAITVTVEAHVNVAPSIAIAAPSDGAVFNVDDGPIAFAATAADLEDGDINAAVQWNSSRDGAFTPPAALSVGVHTVTASVSDSQGLTAAASITVTVEPHVNVAPTLTITAPGDGTIVNEDDGAIAFAATAADPEDGDISAGIQWNSSLDGAFTPPAALSVGTHTVTATVTDSSGLTTVSTITVIVGPHVNLAPEVTITAPLDGDTVYRNNRPVAFAAIAVDAEQGDMSSSVQWSSSLDGAFTPPAILSAGTHVVTASVTDTQGLTASAEITLHVEESDNIVLDYEQFIETGTVANVGTQNWTTVHLAGSYDAMVVVCTPVYDNTAPPMVTRIQNAAGSSFQLKLDRADGQTAEVTGMDVYYVVVQEGVYTEAEHGIAMEAVRMVSTATDGKGSWNGQPQAYANSYVQPVVIGQVMTTNDPAFSVFWSCGASKSSPPSPSALKVGKHAGEDPDTYRMDETLGYLVIESASGVIGGLKYSARVGADIVTGLPKGTSPGISYGFAGVSQPTCAVLSQTAMDGGDGGWPILYGSDPISADALSLVIDEDKMSDAERNHTTEQVSYVVFGQ